MGFIGLFILIAGTLGVTTGSSECIRETARCSQFWEKTEPHKGLMETERELNSWCRKQAAFYECLEDILLAGKDGNVSYLPTNLLISKMFAEDLCTDGSASRRRYLNNAACINLLNTEFCTLPEYLDIVTADDSIPPSRCSLAEKTFSCIAASMVMTCGFDAGKVYRNMLKITRYSDEVCDIEASQGIPHCSEIGPKESNSNRDEQLSEIYYGLVDRMGNIPEQMNVEVSATSTELDSDRSEYEVVTETIKAALDVLDEDILFHNQTKIVVPYENIGSSLYTPDTPKKVDIKDYKKYPIITQIYRGIIFYNYSGLEYTFYWRQPEFTMHENVSCEHLQPSYMRGVVFRCIFEFRTKDPDCVSNATEHEPVTPELIRDIDPDVPYDSIVDFGPRPEWMKSMDEAKEAKRLRDLMSISTTDFPEYSSVSDIPEVNTASTLLHITETVTKVPNKWWDAGDRKAIIPDDIKDELLSLFIPEPEKYVPSPMTSFQWDDKMYSFIYDTDANVVENFTCVRLTECHPRGRGVFRCQAFPRKISPCDECNKNTEADKVAPITYSSIPEGPYAKPAFESTGPTDVTEASGEEDLGSSEEMVTLLFSDESEASDEIESIDKSTSNNDNNFAAGSGYSNSEDMATLILNEGEIASTDEAWTDHVKVMKDFIEEQTSLLDFPDAQMVVLEQNAKPNHPESLNYGPELLYSMKNIKRLGDEPLSEYTLSIDNYGLFNDNVIVLQAEPGENSIEEYDFVDISDY